MKTLFTQSSDRLTVSVKLAPDRLKLFLDAHPKGAHDFSIEEILALCKQLPHCESWDRDVLADVVRKLREGQPVLERRVKKGRPASPGIDGKLLLLVKKFTTSGNLAQGADGDIRERYLFDNIKAGQPVARIYPPKAGASGLDALGEPLLAPVGKPVKLNIDRSLSIVKDGKNEFELLVAECDGYLDQQAGRLMIQPELRITGDLDLRLGNIDFVGALHIEGDVGAGLTVRARRGITIKGGVRESLIECADGEIAIHGFAFGGKKGRIIGGKRVSISMAQELHVQALGGISITKEAIDSELRTVREITVGEALVGGSAYAGIGVESKVIGNHVEKETTVHLCSDPETSEEFAALSSTIQSHQKALELLEAHLGPYATNPGRVKLLNQPFRSRIEGLLEKRGQIEESKGKLMAKQHQLLATAELRPVQRVNVIQSCFPGVMIHADEAVYKVHQLITGPISIDFSREKKEFATHERRPLTEISTQSMVKKESDDKKRE